MAIYIETQNTRRLCKKVSAHTGAHYACNNSSSQDPATPSLVSIISRLTDTCVVRSCVKTWIITV